MNLTEVFDAVLPEIPQTRLARSRPPCLDPDLLVREDILDGVPVVGVLKRDKALFFRFPPAQWALFQFFDGVRSYEEIADDFNAQSGESVRPEDVRAFADALEEAGFWYKSPQEKNVALSQKLTTQRGRKSERKSQFNVANIYFSAWDPDGYLGWLDSKIGKYIYNPWTVLCAIALFAFEATVFISKWSFMGPDIETFYSYTNKTGWNFVEFWLLIMVLGFIHETSHGLTCKHYGGQVHSMGFMFLYLLPAFYVDITEVWVYSTKLQRLAAIIAGIWIELTICGLSMIVWLNTQSGNWIHDFAYVLILLTGVAVVVLNVNPLIKLDGYYFLTEAMGIPELKERSTAFLTGWVQSRILRLPVEPIVVPRRRVVFFVFYAIVSGAYSYFLLVLIVRLSYNIFSHWLAEWALIPAAWVAFVMFKSRLRSLWRVVKEVWELKFVRGRIWHTRPILLVAAALLVVLLFVPLWRDRENAYYVVEPMQSETLHAAVPGRVVEVLTREGERVHAGQPLLTMTSPMSASMVESARAQTRNASFQAFNAELRGQSIGPAAADQDSSQRFTRLATEVQSSLVVVAPADGIVLTADPDALLSRQVGSGQALLDLADDGPRVVRIYIPVAALQNIPAGAEVAIELPGRFSPVHLRLAQPGGDAQNLAQGLVAKQDYQGVTLPVFYTTRMTLPLSAGSPRLGEAGPAKIFGVRRSLAGRMFTVGADLVKAHVW